MIKVQRDGKTFEIEDSEDSLKAARAKGYTPLMTVTKNGKDTFDLNADDTDSVQAAFKKGYMDVNAFHNLEGSRKESQKNIGKLESFGQGVASAGTLGFDDEISAAIAPGDYDENLKTMRRMKKNREEANPISNMAGNVAGGIALPGMGAARATSLLGRVGTGAAVGGAQGAVQGVGDSEGDSIGDILEDAALGGATGAAIGGVTGGLVKPKASAKEIKDAGKAVGKSAQMITEAAAPAFKEGANAGREIAGVDISSIPVLSQVSQVGRGALNAGREATLTAKARKEQAKIAQQALEQFENGSPAEKKEAIETIQRFWEGPTANFSDADVIAARAIAGGENNAATDYVARQAAALGIDADDYKKLLQMSPERMQEVMKFSKREAADDAAPLYQAMKDTFEGTRTERLKELKGKARAEFDTQIEPILQDIDRAYQNAGQLKTTQGALAPINDAFEIIRGGKGADVFGFASGDLATLTKADLFDRLQAARSHIDDNIDWTAIRKGVRSPTPAEKSLMKVRETLDAALKGGSDAKIESDALFRKSKELEDRFFKLASDKDGQHEVSLAKLYGDNDRAVKAKTFLTELEEYAKRPDLPDSLRESVSALADKMRSGMQTADEQRLWGNFNRKTGGPTGPAVNRLNNSLGKRTIANQFIMTPGSALDVKAQAAGMAEKAFSKPFSKLNQQEQLAIVKQLTWQQSKALAQEVVDPEAAAQNWQKILKELGLGS